MDPETLLRQLLQTINPMQLGEGFASKISRASFERPIPGGSQSYCLHHRIGSAGGRHLIVEPGLGVEFEKISRLVRFITEPERLDEKSRRHYLISSNCGFLKEDKLYQQFAIRTEDDISRAVPELESDIRDIVAPIFAHFQRIEDFAEPGYDSERLRKMLRRALLSQIGTTYFTQGPEAAVAVVHEQPSYFYGFGGQPGKAGAEYVVARIREYRPLND